MPFNINGDWIPSKPASNSGKKPVKVRSLKRGKSIVTVVLNLDMTDKEIADLSSNLKKKLACGGAVKEGCIEVQGDKISEIKKILEAMGIKTS